MLADARGALVAIQARDFERAVTFYTAVLGLEMRFRHENFWAEFRAPGLSLGIGAAGDATVVGGGSTTVCFEVKGIDAVVEALRARGVSFAGPVVEKFHGREAYFADSEGNPLMLHESSAAMTGGEKRSAGAAKRSGARAASRSAGERVAKSGRKVRAKAASRSHGSRAAAPKSQRKPGRTAGRRGRGKKGKR